MVFSPLLLLAALEELSELLAEELFAELTAVSAPTLVSELVSLALALSEEITTVEGSVVSAFDEITADDWAASFEADELL